jgi:hypothetical protein
LGGELTLDLAPAKGHVEGAGFAVARLRLVEEEEAGRNGGMVSAGVGDRGGRFLGLHLNDKMNDQYILIGMIVTAADGAEKQMEEMG